MKLIRRHTNADIEMTGEGLTTGSPLLQRLLKSRGIHNADDYSFSLKDLLPVSGLSGVEQGAGLLCDVFQEQQQRQQRITIVGDYDSDGATATAVIIRALRGFGFEQVDYIVPNRFEYGYGLTPGIVEVAAKQQPDWIITVDNGISSIAGVARAHELGIKVIITDHHLPGAQLPDAECIINPNLQDDDFASKNLVGVGVVFYLMLALKRELRRRNLLTSALDLTTLLDIVALGTVGDVVPLDKNNRILVENGLRRIRAGKACAGINALLVLAKRSEKTVTSTDLAFSCAPRINAAGRLDDISVGIECLLANSSHDAMQYAELLNDYNLERRVIEAEMQQEAEAILKKLVLDDTELPSILCLYHPDWHQGVVGILASRIKEKTHRPVIAFARADMDTGVELKGSARSIQGIHIRDLLDEVATRHPDLLQKFGGHAMAAGLSLQEENFEVFNQAIIQTLNRQVDAEIFEVRYTSDGHLVAEQCDLQHANEIRYAAPWGQQFPAPLFDNHFTIRQKYTLKDKHLKLVLQHIDEHVTHQAIAFNAELEQWPDEGSQVHCLYRLDVNEYQGIHSAQLVIEALLPETGIEICEEGYQE